MFFEADAEPDPGPDPESVGAEGVMGVSGWVPPGPDALDLVVEAADLIAVVAAQRLVRIDVLRGEALADARRGGRGLVEVVDRSVRLELAAAMRITEYAAGELMRLSEALVHRYPVVLESLGRAGMTERHAALLVDAVDGVEPGVRQQVLRRAVELAETEPVGTFRRALRRLVDTVRADTLTARFETAVRARRVVVEPADDAMAWLMAYLPAVEAHAAHGRITGIAKVLAGQPGETRTLDQLRADVFGDLLIDGDISTHPPEAHGIRAIVAVTVPVLALLAAGSEGSARAGGSFPAEPATVEGIGPIPVDTARDLCGGADGWMRILTHPETGMVLSVGRDRYRPPPALRKLVRWRADRCMAPGCGVPAARCDIDHSTAWEHGGPTSLSNLNPLCRGHHTIKHHGGWTVTQTQRSSGALEWTSPAGRHYTVQPERPVPTFQTSATLDAPF